jgi:2-hydroxy-6-oxonona-2,4-dienedioate hydrolase
MSLQEYGERWLDVDGIRTRYFEAGQGGPPIVLIHGGQMGDKSGGENAEDWNLNFPELARHRKVISIDRLGQGYTGNPKREEDCTMAASVRHVTRFLELLGQGPYELVGHSRGGYVAARVTLDTPRLANSCVIIDSNTAAPATGRNDVVFCTNPHPPGTLESSRWVYEQYSYKSDHITDDWLAMKQRITVSERNKAAIDMMHGRGQLASRFLPQLLEDKDEFFMRIAQDGFRRPILLMWAWNDPTAPPDLGMKLFDVIARKTARLKLHILNEGGHFSFRERPEEFNRVIIEFVEGVAHGN